MEHKRPVLASRAFVMNKFFLMALTVALVFLLVLTNPDSRQFAEYIKRNETSASLYAGVPTNTTYGSGLRKLLALDLIFSGMDSIEQGIVRHNYILFSHYTYFDAISAIGILGNFIIINKFSSDSGIKYSDISAPNKSSVASTKSANNQLDTEEDREKVVQSEIQRQEEKEQRLSALFSSEIQRRVYRNWSPTFNRGAAIIKFHLDRSGLLVGQPMIIHSTGNARFDKDIISAIDHAAPFSPPEGLPFSDYREVIIKFNASDL